MLFMSGWDTFDEFYPLGYCYVDAWDHPFDRLNSACGGEIGMRNEPRTKPLRQAEMLPGGSF